MQCCLCCTCCWACSWLCFCVVGACVTLRLCRVFHRLSLSKEILVLEENIGPFSHTLCIHRKVYLAMTSWKKLRKHDYIITCWTRRRVLPTMVSSFCECFFTSPENWWHYSNPPSTGEILHSWEYKVECRNSDKEQKPWIEWWFECLSWGCGVMGLHGWHRCPSEAMSLHPLPGFFSSFSRLPVSLRATVWHGVNWQVVDCESVSRSNSWHLLLASSLSDYMLKQQLFHLKC